jgi:hypothetical protein
MKRIRDDCITVVLHSWTTASTEYDDMLLAKILEGLKELEGKIEEEQTFDLDSLASELLG